MISVIVCSRGDPAGSIHSRNCAATVGEAVGLEYVGINNSITPRSLSAVYNEGVTRAAGDILVFMHDDAFFMERGWGQVLERKFMKDASIGLVGVAGTQYLFRDLALWAIAGPPFIKGRVVHQSRDGAEFAMTVFSPEKTDSDVVAVDGVFFAIRREVFGQVKFDSAAFDGFHLYDLDICMQIRQAGYRCLVTPDILVKHFSRGNFGAEWKEYARRFGEKYKAVLPASCCEGVPEVDAANPRVGENVDLRGKMSIETIL